ncbi:MAG TPA: hypothetical protein VIY49_26150 [Bryobacteraceae bacterium]
MRVQNQLIGSVIAILRNGASVGGGPANWTDQTFSLDPGKTLNPNDKITATQTLGGQTSDATPVPIVVQSKPTAPLGALTFASPVMDCSNALLISGAVPGAVITLTDSLHHTRGTGTATQDGSVGVGVSPPLGHGEVLNASQTACGLSQLAPTPSPPPVAPPPVLPMPVVEGPLFACDQAVTVEGVIPGAEVTLNITGGSPETGAFVVSSEYFQVPPLKPGETVTATQAFPNCEKRPATSLPVKVGRAQPPAPPVVKGPLCPGGQSVRLSNLTVGAPVEIFQNGALVGHAGAAKTTDDFHISVALLPNAKITARQSNQCTPQRWSGISNTVVVGPVAGSLAPPDLTKPLYECASLVNVTNIHPGALVQVLSAKNGLIGQKTVYAWEADIPVAPQLTQGDTITAQQIGCGQTSGPSAPVTVQGLPKLTPPVILPITDCARAVRVTGLVPGAVVDVMIQTGSPFTWLASATATLATINVPLPAGVELAAGTLLVARQRLCSQVSGTTDPPVKVGSGQCSYVTQHFDNARTGWNQYESLLTPDSLSRGFAVLATLAVDGQVFAQPLYIRNVAIGAKKHNVLLVATATDWIYGFDADTLAPLWPARQLVVPGGQPVPSTDAYSLAGPADPDSPPEPNYPPDILPTVGIIGTPVVDTATMTMYLVATSESPKGGSGSIVAELHAVDVTTGKDRAGSPVPIKAQFPPNPDGKTLLGDGPVVGGNLQFDPSRNLQRPGLLLLNGTLFIGFGSYGDYNPWHGWLLAYDASTLTQVGVLCTTPDQEDQSNGSDPPDVGNSGGSIWQGGMGIATDGTSVYVATGNGPFNANLKTGRNYGDSILRIPAAIAAGGVEALKVADYFTPWNQWNISSQDQDVGSGGVLVVPKPVGGKSLLVQCGKNWWQPSPYSSSASLQDRVLVLDRTNLGRYGGPAPNDEPPTGGTFSDNVIDEGYTLDGGGVWGGAGYYEDASGAPVVFYCGTGGHITRLVFGAKQQIVQSAQASPEPRNGNSNGFTLATSSNLAAPDTAIVWLVDRPDNTNIPADPNSRLFAFDADTLTKELPPVVSPVVCGSWTASGTLPPGYNPQPWVTKGTFTDPTVADGRVFVGSDGLVTILGLDPALGPE